LETTDIADKPTGWLIRISEVFAGEETEILKGLESEPLKQLGRGYWLIRTEKPQLIRNSPAAKFVRWNLPLHHSWPCNPRKTEGFVEKAAQALLRKFGERQPQTILCGPLDPGSSNRYFKTLASNLRGRTLQIFPTGTAPIRDAEEQDSRKPTLYCLVGKEGLFCGLQSPQMSNGFYPGGTRFISQNSPDTISRAGAKIVEALHLLKLDRPNPPPGSHWLELGASPGGMTAELIARGYQVTAVDRAPLDARLAKSAGLRSVVADAATFDPEARARYDAILSDMNGAAGDAIQCVTRLTPHLNPGGIIIFTLKLPGVATFSEANELESQVVKSAANRGLRLISRTHLTYNRYEFTLFFELVPPDAARDLPL
jgi:SAM-dependent methyltransferase